MELLMEEKLNISIIEHFKGINDPRRQPLHLLHEIFTILICASIAGADDIVGVVTWSNNNIDWLHNILELPNGIPSHDTIGRVLSLIDSKEFEQCFINWTNAVFKKTNGDIIAIDGKVLSGSFDRKSDNYAINIVGAYSTTNKVLLGHVKTKAKSNEVVAIPQLLQLLDIKNCIITIDAIGCQTEIASQIVDKGGDYVLAVKNNQPTLYEEVKTTFEEIIEDSAVDISFYETKEKSRDREETRRYYVSDNIDELSRIDDFSESRAIGMVESITNRNGKICKETRYFILSFCCCAALFANAVRNHWSIENSVHWILDVAFREDDSRIRKDHTPANMGTVRRIALNMVKQEKTAKVGVNNKRKIAGWNNKYLEKIIGFC